jgi:hypothetical protein
MQFSGTNKGGLTIPKEELKPFGKLALKIIATNTTICVDGNDAIKKVHVLLFQTNFAALSRLWNDAITSIFEKEKIAITSALSEKMMKEILLKVLHARVQVFVKSYRETHTSRYSNSSQGDGPLRTMLNYSSKVKNPTSVISDITPSASANANSENVTTQRITRKRKTTASSSSKVQLHPTSACEVDVRSHDCERDINPAPFLNLISETMTPLNSLSKVQTHGTLSCELDVRSHDRYSDIDPAPFSGLNSISETTTPIISKKRKKQKQSLNT